MSTSSQTGPEPRGVSIDYDCPEWCERTDHHADRVRPGEAALHFGPEFGSTWVQQIADVRSAAVALEDYTAFITDPAELRRRAADMVRAAEWLEAHR